MIDSSTNYYIGRRLSYEGNRCTVRYYGSVDGTDGDYVGVEWDDPYSKGKNNGSVNGKTYFKCRSDSPTAATFIRPKRAYDQPLGFLEALRKRYAPDAQKSGDDRSVSFESSLSIGSKRSEDVGFDQIRQQLAALQELRIVVLDSLCINHIGDSANTPDDLNQIRSQGLKIVLLDLSRNLFERWSEVACICSALKTSLRTLTVNGNRFQEITPLERSGQVETFPNLKELSFSATHLSWLEIVQILPSFPSLEVLYLSFNQLSTLPQPLFIPQLRILDLSSNEITSLGDLAQLAKNPVLENLCLRDNPITTLDFSQPFLSVKTLDLSSTQLPNPSSLDPILTVFPSLTSLLTTKTPLATLPSARLLVIARLPTLKELNHTPIPAAERQKAEMHYLDAIAEQLKATTIDGEAKQIQAQNPRWQSLCKTYGEPDVSKDKIVAENDENTLAARMTVFTFYMTQADLQIAQKRHPLFFYSQSETSAATTTTITNENPNIVEKSKFLPRSVDVYRLKGIVGRLFTFSPMFCRLIWETDEWDPIGGLDDGWSVSESDEDESSDFEMGGAMGSGTSNKSNKNENRKGWQRREIELVDSMRPVGFWLEGKEARVRVEPREL